MSTTPFEFTTAKRIIFGPGTLQQLAPVLKGLAATSVLLCTGKTETRAAPVRQILNALGVKVTGVSIAGEPSTTHVKEFVALAHQNSCDVVVAFGGGSVIDVGKAVAALLTNGGDPLDYLEVIGKGHPLTKRPAPFVAIPTTAGTGAEVTKNSVLSSHEHHRKVSLRSAWMLPDVAIVDPETTYSMSKEVTAHTGLDAFTQLLEAYTSNKSNSMTDMICREGLLRAARSLRKAYEMGEDRTAREDMSFASLLGGMALANAKLGGVHGFAGVIGGRYEGAPHGGICAALLPYVLDVNVRALKEREPHSPFLAKFDEAARIVVGSRDATAMDLVQWIKELCIALHVQPLRVYGLKEEDLAEVIDMSAKSSSMQGNPIKLQAEEMREILRRAS